MRLTEAVFISFVIFVSVNPAFFSSSEETHEENRHKDEDSKEQTEQGEDESEDKDRHEDSKEQTEQGVDESEDKDKHEDSKEQTEQGEDESEDKDKHEDSKEQTEQGKDESEDKKETDEDSKEGQGEGSEDKVGEDEDSESEEGHGKDDSKEEAGGGEDSDGHDSHGDGDSSEDKDHEGGDSKSEEGDGKEGSEGKEDGDVDSSEDKDHEGGDSKSEEGDGKEGSEGKEDGDGDSSEDKDHEGGDSKSEGDGGKEGSEGKEDGDGDSSEDKDHEGGDSKSEGDGKEGSEGKEDGDGDSSEDKDHEGGDSKSEEGDGGKEGSEDKVDSEGHDEENKDHGGKGQKGGRKSGGEEKHEETVGSEKTIDTEKSPDETSDDGTTTDAEKEVQKPWGYNGSNGPGNWSKEFSSCANGGARHQSPIKIVSAQTEFLDDTQEEIKITSQHKDGSKTVLQNDGHTAKLSFYNVEVRIEGLGKTHRVASVEFHWGEDNDTGSEHSINNKKYPLEMQVTSYNEEEYIDLEEARSKSGNTSSTVVLAILFELSSSDNKALDPVVENLTSIQMPGDKVEIQYFDLQSLLPKNTLYFFRYDGSLTTPPCSEGVDWIVFSEVQSVSFSQLKKFRQLHEKNVENGDHSRLDYNWRPTQPLNGRTVRRSFPIDPAPAGPEPADPNIGADTQKERARVVGNKSAAIKSLLSLDIYIPVLLLSWKLLLG